MPLLVRYPKLIKAGSVSEDICINIDYAPTFLDLAGVEIPEAMQGKSLKGILAGKTPDDWRKSVYYRYYASPKHSAIRTERYTFIEIAGKYELYDLKNDPQQMNNIADSVEHKALVEKLKKAKSDYEKEIGYSKAAVKNLNHSNRPPKKAKP